MTDDGKNPLELGSWDDSRFRRLVESIEDYGIFMLDPLGRICSWNAGAQRIKGYTEEEILGQHISVFYTDEAIQQHKPDAELQLASREGRYEDESWRLRKDGSRFWANVIITALRDKGGVLQGYGKIVKDMTERRRQEERFRRVVEAAPNAMVIVNTVGQIEMVNAQAELMFGYARSEMLGRVIDILVPERYRESHPGQREMFFGNPQSRPMGAGRDLYGRRKDGSEFPVEIGLNPIETEEGLMVLSSIVDISERKRHEERFRKVVEAAPNGMVMVNTRGKIDMVNAQAERMFGYARNEMLGQTIDILVPDRYRAAHPDKRDRFFGAPQSRPMGGGRDLYGRRKDGSEFPVEIGLNPIETKDGTMVLSSIVDISERKLKEDRIQEALAEKDLLLREIHHRVKNNLHIVHNLLDLQSMRIGDEEVLEMLADCQNRIRSMALIHQTLYQSKDFGKVDFSAFLESLVPTLVCSYGINAGNVKLNVDAGEVFLPINAAVPCGLMVNELITNSLKHGFPQGRAGEIVVKLAHSGLDQMTLTVSDDGVGIPDTLDFEHAETLGLSLALLLAQQLRGTLTIQRRNPTRFTLDFPLKES